jgi:short-subunit dehydrogenase
MPQRVVIIGATSAIAEQVAYTYAARGAQLFLIARHRDRLDAIARQIGPQVAGTATGDFDRLEANDALVDAAITRLGAIDVAVIAHGWLPDQIATERDLDVALRTLSTNFTSAVAFLIPLANHLEAQGGGQIAVLTSVAGERGRPRNYTYGAAKSATSTYLEGLRSRLYAAGVSVHDIRLGPVDTPMTVDHEKNPLFGEARAVALGIVRAIARKQRTVYLPWFWRPIMAIVRRLPEPLFQRFDFLSGR